MHFRKVPLSIAHDWERTKSVAQQLFNLKNRSGEPNNYGNSTHYEFSNLGVLSDHNFSDNWFRITGPVINKSMPWLPSLLDMMQELQPDDGAISYLVGDGAEHIDLPKFPSALNYIFESSDNSAYTWAKVGNETLTYPSVPGTAWILNTQVPHGIINNGTRWTLCIHFGCSFEELSQWFDQHSQLNFKGQTLNGC